MCICVILISFKQAHPLHNFYAIKPVPPFPEEDAIYRSEAEARINCHQASFMPRQNRGGSGPPACDVPNFQFGRDLFFVPLNAPFRECFHHSFEKLSVSHRPCKQTINLSTCMVKSSMVSVSVQFAMLQIVQIS